MDKIDIFFTKRTNIANGDKTKPCGIQKGTRQTYPLCFLIILVLETLNRVIR